MKRLAAAALAAAALALAATAVLGSALADRRPPPDRTWTVVAVESGAVAAAEAAPVVAPEVAAPSRAMEAPRLIPSLGPADTAARAERLRERFGIPGPSGASGLDGWEVRSGDGERRVGLLRRDDGGPRLLVEQLLGRLRDPGPDGAELRRSLEQQLDALAAEHAELDLALVLAIAIREGGPGVVSAGRGRAHSFHEGGLDHLGAELSDLYLPEGYGRRWVAEEPGGANHRGRPRRAAWLPRDEAVVAYGAVLERRTFLLERHAREIFGERAHALLADLGADARRVFLQLAFGRQNGRRGGGVGGAGFGVRTALALLATEIAAGRASSLDDVLENRALREHVAVRRALVTAAEASILDAALGLSALTGLEVLYRRPAWLFD